jgi:Lon protease-like protein
MRRRRHAARLLCGLACSILLLAPAAAVAQIAPLSVPELPSTIPLFPLPSVAVLPYLELPLHIFEPRYRDMLTDALAGERVIGLVQLQPGFEADYAGRPPVFLIGCAAVVVRSEPLPDGSFDIIVRGFVKFRITGEIGGKAYRLAQVEPIAELIDEDARAALHQERPLVEAAIAASLGVDPSSLRLPSLSDEDLVNSVVMNFDFDPVDRQLLIEQPGVLARARKLIEILREPVPEPPTPSR